MTKIDTLAIGIIGSGFMGRTYAECITRYNKNARLVAVAGGTRAPSLAADYGIDHIARVDQLIASPNVDALIITTPEMVHLEQTRKAAAAGKHLLVEKPVAPDLPQTDAMIQACEEAEVTLMVVQSQRFRQVHQRAHQLIREGRIGQVQQVRHWGMQPVQSTIDIVADRPFYVDPAGGGLFMGFNVHCFDLIRWMVGTEAQSIYAQINHYGDHHIPNLSVMAQVAFENKVMAQLWTCLEMPGQIFSRSQFRTQIVGEKGLLDFDGYTHLDLATENGWERIWEQPPLDPLNPADPVRLEAYINMVQGFIDAARENVQPPVSGKDGRAGVELCLAALQSNELGKVVALPL